MNCPDFADLLAHASLGPLPKELQAHVEESCPDCRRRWRMAARVPATSRAMQDGPPAHLERMAMRLGRGEGPLERLVAWIGQLVPPPKLTPALRGAAPAKQLLFEAGEQYELDLTHLDGVELVGQLVDRDGAEFEGGGEVVLEQGEELRVATLDEGGEFQFDAVEAGRYNLLIALDGQRVLFENIDLE